MEDKSQNAEDNKITIPQSEIIPDLSITISKKPKKQIAKVQNTSNHSENYVISQKNKDYFQDIRALKLINENKEAIYDSDIEFKNTMLRELNDIQEFKSMVYEISEPKKYLVLKCKTCQKF